MPFIELAALVVCSTFAGFYFGQNVLEQPAGSDAPGEPAGRRTIGGPQPDNDVH